MGRPRPDPLFLFHSQCTVANHERVRDAKEKKIAKYFLLVSGCPYWLTNNRVITYVRKYSKVIPQQVVLNTLGRNMSECLVTGFCGGSPFKRRRLDIKGCSLAGPPVVDGFIQTTRNMSQNLRAFSTMMELVCLHIKGMERNFSTRPFQTCSLF